MIKAVAYTRFSTDMQSSDSTEAQVREIKKYACSRDIEIIKVYSDEAASGKTDNRPAFQHMLSDAKTGMFNMIIVHKVDRFGRDRYDSAINKAQLKRLGVQLQYAAQHLEDNPEGRLMEGILESFAQYYSENLATETLKGLKTKAYRAEFNGGVPPLGYDIIDKKYVINENEAKVIRLIFQMYGEGMTYGEIIEACNRKGYKTKAGKIFVKNSIHSILSNEKYIGTYRYNKTPSRVYGKRNSHKSKAPDDIIVLKDVIPQIVDKATWNLSYTRMVKNSKRKAQYKSKATYLLSGLVYCGCDAPMNGDKKNNGYSSYYYYRCYNCGNLMRKENLEEFALKTLYDTYFTDYAIANLVIMLNFHLRQSFDSKDEEIKAIKKDLNRVEVEINNVINAITVVGISQALGDKLKDLEQCRNDLRHDLLTLQNHVDLHLFSEDEIKRNLIIYKKHIEDRNIEECKKFINNFIDAIIVYKDNTDIKFTLDYITTALGRGVTVGVGSAAP